MLDHSTLRYVETGDGCFIYDPLHVRGEIDHDDSHDDDVDKEQDDALSEESDQ
ncbi:MAG: hypothetical protein UV70_C0005G0114 [Parcubacteria group bacterium GW2011_GWA2_43_13]|nr:MAG: hypothetical protein UV70_C0005G0114 [Parcubacteria group bacterium GW2011_GWA2_43_13]